MNRSMTKQVPKAALIGLLISCLITSGCGFGSFVAAAEADLPVAIQTVSNILAFVAPGVGSALVTSIGNTVLASLVVLCGHPAPGAPCDANSLIGEYNATTTPSSTLLQKIQAALSAVNANLAQMITIANGLTTVPQIVILALTGAVSLVLQVINAILSFLPAVALKFGITFAAGVAITNPPGTSLTPIHPPSRASFVKAINAALHAYPQAMVQ
jgi:hypothetical protein